MHMCLGVHLCSCGRWERACTWGICSVSPADQVSDSRVHLEAAPYGLGLKAGVGLKRGHHGCTRIFCRRLPASRQAPLCAQQVWSEAGSLGPPRCHHCRCSRAAGGLQREEGPRGVMVAPPVLFIFLRLFFLNNPCALGAL